MEPSQYLSRIWRILLIDERRHQPEPQGVLRDSRMSAANYNNTSLLLLIPEYANAEVIETQTRGYVEENTWSNVSYFRYCGNRG
jgi:hypothetical protein